MERQGADLQTKIEELQIINHSLRENDKVKEDALAHLSDQLLILSERIQQLERSQINSSPIFFPYCKVYIFLYLRKSLFIVPENICGSISFTIFLKCSSLSPKITSKPFRNPNKSTIS